MPRQFGPGGNYDSPYLRPADTSEALMAGIPATPTRAFPPPGDNGFYSKAPPMPGSWQQSETGAEIMRMRRPMSEYGLTPEDRIRLIRANMSQLPHAPIPEVPFEDVQVPEFQMPPEDGRMQMPAAADLGTVKPLSPRDAARAEYEDRMARLKSDYAFDKGERKDAYRAGKAQRRAAYESRPGAQPMMVSQFKE